MSHDYHSLLKQLNEQPLSISASELHGMMTGYLVRQDTPSFKIWCDSVEDISWSSVEDKQKERYERLFLVTHMELTQGQDFTFLLPPQKPLALHLCALKEWTQGFLYALGMDDTALLATDPELQEVIQDFILCSQTPVESDWELTEDALDPQVLNDYLKEHVLYCYERFLEDQES